ncbi:hatching enzyme 1.2-like isoform X1 [Hoplias malabaricus]|uniref:hatching enzyme 1.2-like isoform X1 n=1 Tax=Hoplias malabaricus TaxID=27720 RepID=UPI00346201F0
MHLTLTFILLLQLVISPAQGRYIKEFVSKSYNETDKSIEKDYFTVSSLIERANRKAGQSLDEPKIMFGDIAMNPGFQNADPCTARGCKWLRRGSKVYVPYVISNQYSSQERSIIESALKSFQTSTCIQFTPRRREEDYIHIQSRLGLHFTIQKHILLGGLAVQKSLRCYSFVGRRGGEQVVSLNRQHCVYLGVVQHELLHALGFNHEQTRSDRDRHVRILLQNVIPGLEYNFQKIATLNLDTPYDYNSVMHYGRYAFSRNREPTIIPIPDSNVAIGRATQMNPTDILRINRLYCG